MKRKCNRSKHKLNVSKFINSNLLKEEIKEYYLENNTYPHCLIQLSQKDYHNLKSNSIHVTGIQLINKQMKYSNIAYMGENIKMKPINMLIDGTDTLVHIVDTAKVKKE